ncbi:hypothetical protein [Methylocystis sp. JR02]|uniref:hypothetical protein n=1 Tax=Methylocystis sp. JR02 TaxID=3046284 RepID=UPI0024BAA0AB|nr:hypothetical protein [Methylocystis sp. JR02]MDJ0447214.1 hypothetical protein [Methylocystis sp. JR02]
MDPVTTIGGAEGLCRIAEALRAEGIGVEGVYLIKVVSDEDDVDWVIRIVTSRKSREVVLKVFDLRRAGRIPEFGGKVRVDPVPATHPEASRIIAYARRFAELPVEIETVILDRMLIEYALVADIERVGAAAA